MFSDYGNEKTPSWAGTHYRRGLFWSSDLMVAGQNRRVNKMALSPATDFMQGPDTVEYLIEGILAKGQPCIVGGPAKCLKTLLSVDMALSLASGTPFLGRFAVPKPVKVAFVSLESGATTLRIKARVISKSKGVDPEQPGLYYATEWLVRMPDDLKELTTVMKDAGIEVIMLDPLYMLLGKSAGSASVLSQMGEALRPFTELGLETGATVVLNHHMLKGLRIGQVPGFQDLTGAGVGEWARQFVLVNRRSDFAPGAHHELFLTAGGSAGHAGAWKLDVAEDFWNVSITELNADLARPARGCTSANRGRVLAVLRSAPEKWFTMNAVSKASGVNGSACRKLLDRAVDDLDAQLQMIGTSRTYQISSLASQTQSGTGGLDRQTPSLPVSPL